MPARNAEKNIFTYVCLRSREFEFDRAKRMASDHTTAARVSVQRLLSSTKEALGSVCFGINSPRVIKCSTSQTI